MKIIIVFLVLGLLGACQTPSIVNVDITPVVLPVPLPPERPNVDFWDTGTELSLSYDDSRALIKYLNALDSHREELLLILEYYKAR